MKDRVLVKSVESLYEMEASLAIFATQVHALLKEVNRKLKKKKKMLQERYNYWKKQKNYWVRTRENSDNRDEVYHINDKIDEAKVNLQQIAYWKNRVKDAESNYRHFEHVLERIVEIEIPYARSSLRKNIDHLEEYLALQVDLSTKSSSGIFESGNDDRRNLIYIKSKDNGVSGWNNDSVLPQKFRWVSLSEVKMNQINDQLIFEKVSYEEMKIGLRRLRSEIIPALAENNKRNKEYFREQDRETGLSYSEGQLKIYEAFFGGDHIRLEKYKEDKKYSITNGRHRIKIAKELGWEVIPAQAMEVDIK